MSISSLRLFVPFFLLGLLSLTASPDTDMAGKIPTPMSMQVNVWKQFDLSDITLQGEIRTDKTKHHYPLTLRTRGHELVYEFTNQPLQIRMVIGQDGTLVQRRSSPSAPWTTVSPQDRRSHILDTDLTYEDLSLQFINWDDVKPVGTDSIKTLPAYTYDATAGPTDVSSYAKVRFWISSQFWAFLRVDAYNKLNQVVKIVEIQSVMKIKDYTVFKEMRVASIVPGLNDISSSTTFIDITDGKEGSGLTSMAIPTQPLATGNPNPPGPVISDKVDVNAPSAK